MKIKYLARAASTTFLLAASPAVLADNTITFNGEIVAQTCDPSNNGDLTVNLAQVTASEFSALTDAALVSVSTPFALELKNCPASASKVTASLWSAAVDGTTGNLVDAAYDNNSRNVQIQVRDEATAGKDPLVIGNAATSATTPATIANGSASIPLRAFYYVKKGSTVADGRLSARATYVLRTN